MERSVRFAVLPELAPLEARHPDLGVDVGLWEDGDLAGVIELASELGCGALKVGIPVGGQRQLKEPTDFHAGIAELIRRLAAERIETTGVLTVVSNGETAPPRLADVVAEGAVNDLLSPIFAFYGGLVPNWQLGPDRGELSGLRPWQADGLAQVRAVLQRFVTYPELVAPQPLALDQPIGNAIRSLIAPSETPARDLAAALESLAEPGTAPRWVYLDHEPATHWTDAQLAELARRYTLARALPADRLYVPAPFELSQTGGAPGWAPTDAYVVLRNLIRHLSGKTATAVMRPAEGVLTILFEGEKSSCVVVWSWRAAGPPPEIDLYLGREPRAVDLWGRPVALELRDERAILRPTPEPIIIESLHLPLALLQASFRMHPLELEVHRLENGPVISFTNPFSRTLTGRALVRAPAGWNVEPREWEFTLDPQQTEERPLRLTLPSRELARGHGLTVLLDLFSPEEAHLAFPVELSVGLKDIELITTPYWNGANLVIEMTLRNQSDRPVGFNAFCELPGRPRLEGVFLDLAAGESATRLFVVPDADRLRGALIDTGVAELNGRRRLDQVVTIPE